MKQLTCEMCGSTDLLKQDGVFVCQSCGTKYSVEEAKKMMIEGTVDVSGSTVKVDTSDELANLYQIARRAKDDNNSENAAKYYDMILVKDPTSWEASFYVIYFKAMGCRIAQIQSAAISVSNCEENVLMLIRDNVQENDQAAAVNEVMLRSTFIANMLASGAKSHYDGISSDIKGNYTNEYIKNLCAAIDIVYNCGTQIDRIFGDNPEIGKLAADAWKSGIEIQTRIMPSYMNVSASKNIMISYAEKIGKYDPEYAKNYVYSDKKKELEDELSKLKNELSAAETPTDQSSGIGMLVFGIIGIIFCAAIMIPSANLGATNAIVYSLIAMCIFLIMALAGGSARKSVKQQEIDKPQLIASLKSQIEAKQTELNNLEK